jgi:hypothetical protein
VRSILVGERFADLCLRLLARCRSVEDGFDEKDYDGWTAMTAAFAKEHPGFMIVGDDLYTTNTSLITQGVEKKWANALLLKVNQIGTVSESMDAARLIFADKGQVSQTHIICHNLLSLSLSFSVCFFRSRLTGQLRSATWFPLPRFLLPVASPAGSLRPAGFAISRRKESNRIPVTSALVA